MSQAAATSQDYVVPPHVPEKLVVDFDIYNVPLQQGDYHLGLKQLHKPGIPDIFWSPRNGGHWIATRGDDIYHIFKEYQDFTSTKLQPPPSRTAAEARGKRLAAGKCYRIE